MRTSTIFLSTPSGWRATVDGGSNQGHNNHFYPRPPGGGRPETNAASSASDAISIHALRVEGDLGATTQNTFKFISIHALRVEGDRGVVGQAIRIRNFYPRPPGGGRQSKLLIAWRAFNFYPRPPGGGRHGLLYGKYLIHEISIHALRVEGD